MNPVTTEDDEIPSPPAPELGTGQQESEASFSSEIDASQFDEVPKRGDAIPIGTYVFRLDAFKKTLTKEGDNKGQPNFSLQWKCQQEPYTGRVVFENVPWVSAQDTKDAADPTSPRRAEAKKTINNRLPAAKEIMEAAGFKPTGKFGFEQFLGGRPEMKLQLKVVASQTKGADGRYVADGGMRNEIQKHISLMRPA